MYIYIYTQTYMNIVYTHVYTLRPGPCRKPSLLVSNYAYATMEAVHMPGGFSLQLSFVHEGRQAGRLAGFCAHTF